MYILILILWILAAICNAVMDVIAHKYEMSIFSNLNSTFWDPEYSWERKYKNNNYFSGKPKFFGSTTFLVFTTDAWHLFQFLSNSFIIIAILIAFHMSKDLPWWAYIIEFAILKTLWGLWFELFYSKVFIKN